MSNLDKLKEAGIAHPRHEFSAEEQQLLESLSEEEVRAVIKVKGKLGKLAHKKAEDSDPHPDTLVL